MLDLELGKVETIRPPDQSVESEPFPTTLRVRAYTDACSHFRRKAYRYNNTEEHRPSHLRNERNWERVRERETNNRLASGEFERPPPRLKQALKFSTSLPSLPLSPTFLSRPQWRLQQYTVSGPVRRLSPILQIPPQVAQRHRRDDSCTRLSTALSTSYHSFLSAMSASKTS